MDLFSTLTTLLLLALFTKSYVAEKDWRYDGKDTWPSKFMPACNGTKQSPIDIKTSEVKERSLPEIVFHNYNKLMPETNITNDGHTLQLNAISTNPKVYISGGEFPDNYNFIQLHFHWGKNDKEGSEHTINQVKYPLELHLVHFREGFKNFDLSYMEPKGLAVLGILFEIYEKDNTNLNTLIEYVQKLKNAGENIAANNAFRLDSFLPTNLNHFYRYDGSLTTPKCYESVIWTVFQEKVKISKTQLSKFRELLTGDGNALQDNYRNAMPLNGRVIYTTSSGTVHNSVRKIMRKKIYTIRMKKLQQKKIQRLSQTWKGKRCHD